MNGFLKQSYLPLIKLQPLTLRMNKFQVCYVSKRVKTEKLQPS